jgi:hypothetical protein
LIRQYFKDIDSNSFWIGVCNSNYESCKSFSPSGVLVKAVILHSGTGLTGNEPPDNVQGYGRILLASVLPLKGIYTFDLFVSDLVYIQQQSTKSYFVRITDSTSTVPLKLVVSAMKTNGCL